MTTLSMPRNTARRSTMRRYLTPQHGVWPMLLVPYVAGVVVAGPVWWDIPLLIVWVAGYLLSYHGQIAVKTRRPERVRGQLILYTAITVPFSLLLVVAFPSLLWFAPVYGALLAVNAWHSWRKRERAMLNDLASVAMCVLVAPMAAVVAGEPASSAFPATAAVLLYFVGTVPYVKTVIRERGVRRYYVGSIAYHAVAAVLAGFVSLALVPLFVWFLVRSAWLPRLRLVPLHTGMVEILNCVLLVLILGLWV